MLVNLNIIQQFPRLGIGTQYNIRYEVLLAFYVFL